MGVLNVTPDSFSDGGVRFDPARAVEDGLRMVAEGADILDVGGESTRPGADALPAEEELRRVVPVIEQLVSAGALVSIDTYKAVVAREAIARGAAIVNDISGFLFDGDLPRIVAETRVAVVLMHNRGRSRDMYKEAAYTDVPRKSVASCRWRLTGRRTRVSRVTRSSSIRDLDLPNVPSIPIQPSRVTRYFRTLDRPVLCGPSRKSFLTAAIGQRTARRTRVGDGGRGHRQRSSRRPHRAGSSRSPRWST